MVNNTMRITGFSSGLDTTQIINDLMKAERAPLDRLFQKKEWLEWQRDAYRDVNLEMSKFKSQVEKLRLESSFNGYKASSSDTNSVGVIAKGNAVPGNYQLNIESLAEVAKIKTNAAITTSGGTPVKSTDKVLAEGQSSSIIVASAKGKATIEIDDTDTYSSLAKKIAAATDETSGESLGLRASFDDTTSTFIISTKDMGDTQGIAIFNNAGTNDINVADLIKSGGTANKSTGPDTVPPDIVFNAKGKNAIIEFDGNTIEQASNTVSIYGVELKLLKADKNATHTIRIESDTESIFNNIKEFVNSYNAMIDSLGSKINTRRNRDFAPLTDEQREGLSEKEAEKWDEKAKQGLLYNDSIITGTLSNLRTKMYTSVDGIADGQIKFLSEIGIKTAYLSKDGKLEIDDAKLREAIANKPDEVTKLFTTEDGIANKVYNEMNAAIDKLNKKSGRPNTAANLDISVIGKSLNDLKTEMSNWEKKLALIENRYWKQFTAMEQAISKMNNQSSSIVNMFN